MRIRDLFESYKDANRIISDVYVLGLGARMGDTNARNVGLMDIKRFKDHASKGRIPSNLKDISMWIGLANKAKTHDDAYSWILSFRGILSDAEDKLPDFDEIISKPNIKITHIANFAAAKKLCSNMRVCVRSSQKDFDMYNKYGALFLVELKGKKYVYEYDKRTGGGTFWDSSNEEHDPIEILSAAGVQSLPKIYYHNNNVEDALEFLNDELSSEYGW